MADPKKTPKKKAVPKTSGKKESLPVPPAPQTESHAHISKSPIGEKFPNHTPPAYTVHNTPGSESGIQCSFEGHAEQPKEKIPEKKN